ncbi:unnamed protein product, partial [Cyprideis torosa]
VFGIGDECYVVRPQMDTIENQAVFCNNLSQGYLAPAGSYPVGINDTLTDFLEPADHLFLGTQLTSNPDVYTCEPQSCASLWIDENKHTLQVANSGANKACLVLDQHGLASYQCQKEAFALCRVFSGRENSTQFLPVGDAGGNYAFGTKMYLNCSCFNATPCHVQLTAVCYGYPMNWFYYSTPSVPCSTLFGFEDHCYYVSKTARNLENATMHCKKEFNGYVSPAISSDLFIESVQEKSNEMNLTGSIILSTHLTFGVYRRECKIVPFCTGTYPYADTLDQDERQAQSQAKCGEVPSITEHVPRNQSNDFGARIDVDYSCPCDNGTGTVPAVCLGHPVGWLFPYGIHICEICTTTESTTMETTTDSTTLPSTSDKEASTSARDISFTTLRSITNNPPSTSTLDSSTSAPSPTATKSPTPDSTTDSTTIPSTEATSTEESTSTASHPKREYFPTLAISQWRHHTRSMITSHPE